MNSTWLQQIKHLLRNGRTQEAVSAVQEAEAATPGSPDVLLGLASIAYYGRDDYAEALRLSAAAIEGARAADDKLAEANARRTQANALRLLGRYEESLVAANAALEVARDAGDKLAEANALQTQANALRMLNRYEESLAAANAALEVARDAGDKLAEANTLRAQANALRLLGRCEESLEAANAALAAARAADDKLARANALGTRADALARLDRYDECLATATAALGAARDVKDKLAEANALRAQADALRMLNRPGESLAAATTALAAARAAGYKLGEANALQGQVISLSELGRSTDREAALASLATLDPELAKRLERVPIRPGWYPLVRRILKDKGEREAKLNRILNQEPDRLRLPAGFVGKFQVLRKWASYTTVDLTREQGGSGDLDGGISGGGYYLWWDGWGLVIDPGLGFCKAFRSADLVPRHISAIVATHHHIDHTGDVLPILTCIFEMNQQGKKPHQVDFALSPGAFGAFADVVAYVPGVRSVQLLRPSESLAFALPNGQATITGVQTEHRDLTGRDDAGIGLIIELSGSAAGESCRIGLCGDTRFVEESAELFKDVDLMVVHIGSLYEYDLGGKGDQPWHLGFSGTVALLKEIKKDSRSDWDPFVLVSEWGEELGPDRTEICEALRETVEVPRVFPAELLQSVALKPGKAEPVCSAPHADGKIATHWHEAVAGSIEYLCDQHDHRPNTPRSADGDPKGNQP